MKFATIALLHLLLASHVANGDPSPEVATAGELHDKVDLLMKEKKADEAIPLLEKALELDPGDAKALRKLGMIYSIILHKPKEGIPYLEKSWKLGDAKSLEALGLSFMISNDDEGIERYKKDFIAHFKDLRGTRVIAFHIAMEDQNEPLFWELLKQVSEEDLKRDATLSSTIAMAAKVLADKK